MHTHTDKLTQTHKSKIFTAIGKQIILFIKTNPLRFSSYSLLQPSSASTSMSTMAATSHLGGASGLD